MRGTIADDGGAQHRVSRIWVTDDAGVRHEVVRAWVGDSQWVPRLWFDKDAVLELAVTATALDATQVRLSWVLGPQGEVAQSYKVYRDGVLVQTTPQLTWNDSGLSPGTTYTYRVDAVQGGVVTVSGTAEATTDTYVPPAVATLTATAGGYDRINLSWTVSGHDTFTVKRGSTVLATTGTSFTETGLTPGTAYTYTLTAFKAGASNTTVTRSATTTALPAFSMSASDGTDWNSIATSWTNLGSGWTYTLVGNGSNLLTGTTSTSYSHAVGESQNWSYTTYAYYNGVHYRTASNAGYSRARNKQYGQVAGHGPASGYTGWTGSTRRDLNGRAFAFPVSGTMYNVNAVVYGHYDKTYNPAGTGRVAPVIGGVERSHSIFGSTRQANDMPVDVGYAAATHQVNIRCGGKGVGSNPNEPWGQTTWSPPEGVAWDYNVCVHRVDYWFWESALAEDELRRTPFWDDRLAGRNTLFIETTDDGEGNFTSARITDRDTDEVLVEWQREA